MVTFQGGGDGAQPRGGACAGHERQHGSGVRLPGDGVEHLVGSDNRTQRQVSEQQSDQGVYNSYVLMLQLQYNITLLV